MENFDIAKIKKYGIIAAIILVVALGLVALGVFVIAPKLQPKGGTVSTITESKLERILEISQLNTVEYTYNAVATIYNEDYTYIKYYVAYDGTVKAGIDFSKVDVSVDETTKTIFINLPDVEIMDVLVDAGSMEYIFPDEFMESETIAEEAYRLCNENLRMKAENEEDRHCVCNCRHCGSRMPCRHQDSLARRPGSRAGHDDHRQIWQDDLPRLNGPPPGDEDYGQLR